MDEDEFPSLAKVWERLEGEDNHFQDSLDRCSAATLKGLLRAGTRTHDTFLWAHSINVLR